MGVWAIDKLEGPGKTLSVTASPCHLSQRERQGGLPDERTAFFGNPWRQNTAPLLGSPFGGAVWPEARLRGLSPSQFNARVAPAKRVAGQFDALQNPRSNQLRAEKSFRLRRSFRRAPARPLVLLFLSSTVHGAFSFFLPGRKRENGGCIAQPSLVARPPRPQGRAPAPSPPGEQNTQNPP